MTENKSKQDGWRLIFHCDTVLRTKKFFFTYKLPIILACIQWYLCTALQWDRLFFEYNAENSVYLFIKAGYLLVLLIGWCSGAYLYKEYKKKNTYVIRGVYIASIYVPILLLILLILWPGTWSWDDSMMLLTIKDYHLFPWQHIITSIYQMLLLQILPFPAGIIFLQNIFIGIIVSYILVLIENTFENFQVVANRFFDTLIKLVPFLFPPVLAYQFSGYRIGLYIFLELLFFVIMITAWKRKEILSEKKLFIFVCLSVIVSTWRTESFIYLPVAALFIFMQKSESRKRSLAAIVLLFMGAWGVTTLQSNAMHGSENYKVMSTIRQGTELVRHANQEKDKNDLYYIDKVIDTSIVRQNTELDGERLYWNKQVVRNNYSSTDYHEYIHSLVNLARKYPSVLFEERTQLFFHSAIYPGWISMERSISLYNKDLGKYDDKRVRDFQNKNWIANKPVFLKNRAKFIAAMGRIDKDGHRTRFFKLVWNCTLPLIIIMVSWIYGILKRKWFLVICLSSLLAKLLIIILTAPAGWMMYYLSFYLIGYVILIYGGICLYRERKALHAR